jgi:hypothetical protein
MLFRPTRPALLAGVVVLAGCGGSDERPASGPASGRAVVPPMPAATAQPLDYAPGVRAEQRDGAVAVVDLANRVGIEPRTMDVNKQQSLSRLRWEGWGRERATGRGRVRILVCEPTCAQGRVASSSATIVLSAPRRCAGRRYYTRSTMTYEEPETGRTRAPATYLRTPPC